MSLRRLVLRNLCYPNHTTDITEAALEREYVMGPYFAVTSRYLPDKEHHPVRVLQYFDYMKDVEF